MIDVALVVLNYNTFSDVTRMLKSVTSRTSSGIRKRFIVVDNASTIRDGEAEMEAQLDETDIYLQRTENSGYAVGNNLGIRKAIETGAKYSLVLNPDIIISDVNDIDRLVTYAESREDMIIVGPKIRGIAPYVKRPSLTDFLFPFVPALRGVTNSRKEDTGARKVFRVSGSAMLLHNARFEEIGLMDERTFLFFEENIIAEKAMRSGYTTYYYPTVEFIHEHSQSINKTFSRKKYGFFRDSAAIYLHNYRGIGRLASKLLAANFTYWRMVINTIKGRI